MPRQTQAEARRQAREAAAAAKEKPVSGKGFDPTKIKDVPSEKPEAAKGSKKEQRSYYNATKDEPMIKRVEQLAPYKMLVSRGIENIDAIIARYREKGSLNDRQRLSVLAYGGYATFSSARNADIIFAIAFKRYNDAQGNVKEASVTDLRQMVYDRKLNTYVAHGGKRFRTEIAALCKELKLSDKQIEEFLSKGYIEGTAQKCITSKRGKELFDAGKISAAQLSSPEYSLGIGISSWPDGAPLKFFVDAAKENMKRMMGVKDDEGKDMGFVFKDYGHTYTLTEQDLDNLAFGMTVSVTSDKGKTEVLRYNPFAEKITPAAFIGKALRVANKLEHGEAVAEEEAKGEERSADKGEQVSAEEAAGLGIGE